MNLQRAKKAVSPVIAVVLIIALTAAAAGVVWVIFNNLADAPDAKLIERNIDYFDLDGNQMVDKIDFEFAKIAGEDVNITEIKVEADGIQRSSWTLLTASMLESNEELIFSIQTVSTGDQLTADDNNVVTLTTSQGASVIINLDLPASFSSTAIGEAGVVEVGASEVTVSFSKTYKDPVVVVTAVTNGSTTIRSGTPSAQWPVITKVTTSSFTLKQSTDSSDTNGVTFSNVSYIVMEVGVHYLHNIQVVVGKETVTGQYANYTFAKNFTALPVVIASPQTNNMETNNGGARTRFNNLGGSFVTMQLEEGANSNPGINYVETVGYIAIEAGIDSFSQVQSYTTADAFSHNFKSVGFDPIFIEKPVVLSHMYGEDGGDASYTVVTDITSTSFKTAVEEPSGRDGPHTNERISWIAIPAGAILGTTESGS